jgi:Glycosyltransferases, probably involved in cell wall biogenesis
MDKLSPHIVIVIPSYNEPDLSHTLDSLFRCAGGDFCVEVLVVFNSWLISPPEAKEFNRASYASALDYARRHNTPHFYLTPLLIEDLPGHQTGAGLPRKIGMDEAIKHFNALNKKKGIIVSLDADTTVAPNYLTELYKAFRKYKLNSATINFHHPVEHLGEDDPLRLSTELYELYLHYYRDALEYTGFPYAYHTIGSAFAVTADTYLRVGGMGRQQAGEDFYFLHKVFPLEKTRFIDTTCVYPQARTSDRVPFGTGPAVAKMMEDDSICKLTYQAAAFDELRQLFSLVDSFFGADNALISYKIQSLPPHLQYFLQEDVFLSKMDELNTHTANLSAFRKRFFSYFTAFKILKYMNAIHPAVYELSDVRREYNLLRELKKRTAY